MTAQDLLDKITNMVSSLTTTAAATALSVELKSSVLAAKPAVDALNESAVALGVGLNSIVAASENTARIFSQIANKSLALELRNKELNKTFGINSTKAAELSSKLQGTADAMGVSGKQMMKYAGSIKGIIPTINVLKAQNNDYYKGLARVQQVLTTNLGLSEEQAASYSLFAAGAGKNAEDQLASQAGLANAIEKSTGIQGSFKMITEGIAETTADLQLQYGRIPGALELGILKAKSLGFTMADLNKTADNLLNIESSIGQELEYQLLSGRRLVGDKNASAELQGKSLTNAYREATLQGNASKQANTLNAILEQEGDTLRTNLFARKQMSELLGMDEAALSRALQKKSILEQLPGGEALFDQTGDALLEAAANLAGDDAEKKKLIEDLKENEDTRTTDQKIEQTLAMMVETGIKAQLVDQAGTVSKTSAELQKKAKEVVPRGTTVTQTATGPTFQGPKPDTIVELGNATIGELGKEIGKQEAAKNITSVTPQEDSSFVKPTSPPITTNDLIATPTGYGDRILLAGEDTFALNNNDTIVAGTNLMGGNNKGGSDDKLSAVMMQVGAMIVNAINRKQTDQLFNGGINAPTYG
jgi:hypothetical protein